MMKVFRSPPVVLRSFCVHRVSPKRTIADPNRRRRPWLICAVLAVVFGRGPVSWIHTHATLAHESDAEHSLAWHLEHFHPAGDDEHGWHLHWTLPWHILNCPCQHDTTPADERVSALEMPLDAQPTVSVQSEAGSSCVAPPAMLATVGRWDRPPWDPLASSGIQLPAPPLTGVSLRALYCVAQC